MFKVQISNPEILTIVDKNDKSIEEAIQTIFPLETEYGFVIWNHIFIPVSYKYDISFMIKDFILLCKFIEDENEKTFQLHWVSNTFASQWELVKKGDSIQIKTVWSNVIGRLEGLLNSNSEITIKSILLAQEIQSMIVFIKKSLESVGYNSKNLDDFYLLEGCIN
jgi:hypothetical protein